MAVNRYKNHLVIYLEDAPYRDIVAGIKNLLEIDGSVIDTRPPCGGWPKVFAELEDNLRLLNARDTMHALLLMDFDNDHDNRMQRLGQILDGQPCKDRVFVMGIDDKESEDLKATLGQSDYQEIGKLLIQDCISNGCQQWQNQHLQCNENEIQRIRNQGVLDWLQPNST